jgi:rRNA processing protein Krr1/Pno1
LAGSALRDIIISAGGSDDRRELARTVQFPKAEQDGNTIKIEGKADVVDKIIAAMQKIVTERESQTTEIIDVPTDKHRSLIGRGGETKKDLETKFAVSIDIPRQGSEQTGIKLTGLPAAVEKAKSHILDLVKDQEGVTVQVPKKLHHLIADNGSFFRKLRNDLQVTVDHAGNKLPAKPTQPANTANGSALPLITDETDDADVFSWHVVDLSDSAITGDIPWILRGNADNLAKAKSTLEAAIEQSLKSTCTGYLGLPDPRKYRYVIGQGGSKVNSIRKATGCKITVPRDQSKDDKIEVVGTADGVEKARELILKAVKEANNSNGGFGGRGANGGERNGNWE